MCFRVALVKTLAPWKKSYDQPRHHIIKQRLYFAEKGPSSQSYGFSSSHVGMWELDYKESWALKNWCFWTVVLEKTVESPLNCKEIQPVSPKGNESWIFIGKTAAEAETPICWLPDDKNWLLGKDPNAGKDWRWEEKGTTEDEMVGWHHWLNEHESEWTLGVGNGQGGLACCFPLSWTRLSDWTGLTKGQPCFPCIKIRPTPRRSMSFRVALVSRLKLVYIQTSFCSLAFFSFPTLLAEVPSEGTPLFITSTIISCLWSCFYGTWSDSWPPLCLTFLHGGALFVLCCIQVPWGAWHSEDYIVFLLAQ